MAAINFPTVRLNSDDSDWTDNDPLQTGDQIERENIKFEWNGIGWIKVSTTFTTEDDGDVILSTGTNVGIGVTPTEKLHVDGTVKATGLDIDGTEATFNGHDILTENDIDPDNIDADTLNSIASSGFVQTSNAQSIGGIKTFTDNPIISAASPKLSFNDTDTTGSNNAEIDTNNDNITLKADVDNSQSNSFISLQ